MRQVEPQLIDIGVGAKHVVFLTVSWDRVFCTAVSIQFQFQSSINGAVGSPWLGTAECAKTCFSHKFIGIIGNDQPPCPTCPATGSEDKSTWSLPIPTSPFSSHHLPFSMASRAIAIFNTWGSPLKFYKQIAFLNSGSFTNCFSFFFLDFKLRPKAIVLRRHECVS